MQPRLVNKIREYLKTQPVERAWIFGSFSRNEQNLSSDIDIMLSFSQPNSISLLTYINMQNRLSDLTGRKVDLVEEGFLKEFAKANFEKEKVLIYERNPKG